MQSCPNKKGVRRGRGARMGMFFNCSELEAYSRETGTHTLSRKTKTCSPSLNGWLQLIKTHSRTYRGQVGASSHGCSFPSLSLSFWSSNAVWGTTVCTWGMYRIYLNLLKSKTFLLFPLKTYQCSIKKQKNMACSS